MTKKLFSTRELCYIALFAAVIAISAWIAIPAALSFTMQTFAVFCTVGLLGTKCAVATVITYVLLGTVGLPVFTGFTGGAAVRLDQINYQQPAAAAQHKEKYRGNAEDVKRRRIAQNAAEKPVKPSGKLPLKHGY